MSNEEVAMQRPPFRPGWDINTVAVVLGFIGTFSALGVTWGQVRAKVDTIDKLETRLTAIETDAKRLENHELRLISLESQTSDATAAMRQLQSTLSALAGDMQETRAILQRLEEKQNKPFR